ncbi:MAG: 30S ribosomal protein S6 [Deltaproteobacteria bacterium]|nr:30S ribosomal protein S6 [Deltaproteobacteria bacterium]
MRHYETIYIVNPNLSQDEYRDVLDKYTTLIEKNNGAIVKTEEWGTQRLAYDVKKFDKGAYVLLNYCAKPGLSAELERDLNLDDRVLKFQTIKLAHEADPKDLLEKQKDLTGQTTGLQEQTVESVEPAAMQPSEEHVEEERGDA